ncbi:unnamed protein product, partial [Iphiclides podalirius]
MMTRDLHDGNFGDSERNRSEYNLRYNRPNHIFNEAGENVQCHSDSESLGSRKSKTRYVNPAIYIETVEASHSVTSLRTDLSCVEDLTPHPHGTYRSNSTPFLTGRISNASSGSVKRKSCRLAEHECQADDEETPRLDRTYREDGPDTFRLSVASLSTTTTTKEERERHEKKRQEAFKQWLERKEQEKREKRRMQETKRQTVQTTTPEQREESFRRWTERKRLQMERRRAEEIMRRFRQNEHLEREKEKKEREKQEKLAEWIRKKEEEMKAMKTREERRAARAAIEEQRRRADGERAYRDWLRTSKNKPLPVPLNQGELSMRGSVSQMYINPVPWKSEL